MCTINNCKISSATLITIYTNLVKTKILRILDLSVYFFTKLQKKKESFQNKYCVNFALIQKKLSKELIKAKLALRHL